MNNGVIKKINDGTIAGEYDTKALTAFQAVTSARRLFTANELLSAPERANRRNTTLRFRARKRNQQA